MRAGGTGRGAGESMGRPGGTREDLPTLRVTNVSEDTSDQDLRDLFSNFGRVARVYIGRDRETGQGKGYAFVSFEDRAAAEIAIQKVNGRGYDNLILSVGWSRKLFASLLLLETLDLMASCSQNQEKRVLRCLAIPHFQRSTYLDSFTHVLLCVSHSLPNVYCVLVLLLSWVSPKCDT